MRKNNVIGFLLADFADGADVFLIELTELAELKRFRINFLENFTE